MNDRSHCPTDAAGNPHQYFSPVAPPEYCVHQVPEPSGVALAFIALIVLWIVRRRA